MTFVTLLTQTDDIPNAKKVAMMAKVRSPSGMLFQTGELLRAFWGSLDLQYWPDSHQILAEVKLS